VIELLTIIYIGIGVFVLNLILVLIVSSLVFMKRTWTDNTGKKEAKRDA